MTIDPIFYEPGSRQSRGSLHRSRVVTPTHHDVNIGWRRVSDNMILTGREAMAQKILNVLGRLPGSEHFSPFEGSEVALLLFEPITQRNAQRLKIATITAIDNQMRDVLYVYHAHSFVVAFPEEDAYGVQLAYEDLVEKTPPEIMRFGLPRTERTI